MIQTALGWHYGHQEHWWSCLVRIRFFYRDWCEWLRISFIVSLIKCEKCLDAIKLTTVTWSEVLYSMSDVQDQIITIIVCPLMLWCQHLTTIDTDMDCFSGIYTCIWYILCQDMESLLYISLFKQTTIKQEICKQQELEFSTLLNFPLYKYNILLKNLFVCFRSSMTCSCFYWLRFCCSLTLYFWSSQHPYPV